ARRCKVGQRWRDHPLSRHRRPEGARWAKGGAIILFRATGGPKVQGANRSGVQRTYQELIEAMGSRDVTHTYRLVFIADDHVAKSTNTTVSNALTCENYLASSKRIRQPDAVYKL
ncbi:hypothetical protein, partial [Frankia sp. CIT1]|uniref:hypothetical protein n=1 Tax=Frankia sp. CIT1 TaxID=2880974 RepID=UPI001EF70C9D